MAFSNRRRCTHSRRWAHAARFGAAIGVLLLALASARASHASAREHAPPTLAAGLACPEGTRPGINREECFPVRDARGAHLQQVRGGLPNLGEQRRALRRQRSLEPVDAPVPGGIGIGTLFQPGQLSVTAFAELETTMFVQPSGLEPSTGNLDWLFSTSTNRTKLGVEFVASYRADEPGWLGVFDWSCSVSDPCPGGQTGPDWIVSFPLGSRPEYLFQVFDDGGHLREAVRYVNRTERLPGGGTPRWRNRVLLWNGASEVWDLVYEHTYRARQPDCSMAGCAWWGPILEDFRVDASLPLPEIRELGFQDTRLRHDGRSSDLGPSETSFVPPAVPWLLAHLEANGGYGVGNDFGVACGDGVDNDGDGLVDWAGGDPGCDDGSDASEHSDALPCDDGRDNDADGWADFAGGDPGCRFPASPREDPQCQDGVDNDGQPGTDFDGGISAGGAADPAGPDPECSAPWMNREARPPPSCGIGAELMLALPLLGAARRRRQRGRRLPTV